MNTTIFCGSQSCAPDSDLAVSMQSESPLTLILSPLRAGRGELALNCLGSLFGDPDTVPPKVPLSLRKRERVRVRVRLDCMDTAEQPSQPIIILADIHNEQRLSSSPE